MSGAAAELDWRCLPLDRRALIEASAGTGKTYNIALLHLRLVLESGLSVRQILVCTFTESAASELVDRLRARLEQAEQWLDRGDLPGADDDNDPLGRWLQQLSLETDSAQLLARARNALAELDLAPISTIHGYCRRLLNDYPFDSGSSFRPGEVADQQALLLECVEDWWRLRYQVNQVSRMESVLVLPQGPKGLARRVADLWQLRRAQMIAPPVAELQALLETLYSPAKLAELDALIADTSYFKRSNSKLRSMLSRLRETLASGTWIGKTWSELSEIDDDLLAAQSNARRPHDLARNPYIRWLRAELPMLLRQEAIALNAIALEALRFVEQEMPRRLAERNLISFDSMIEQVHAGLQGDAGRVLADRVFEAMPAALIDEFQDTDLQQWAIFDRIYSERAGGPARGTLILIGDPKQSIYSFRGADVYAYLRARDSVSEHRSISTNYRSSRSLIAALNGLYAAAGSAAFHRDQIRYHPVSAAGDERMPRLYAGDQEITQPLRLRRLAETDFSLDRREDAALRSCADEICVLLGEHGWRLGEQALRPGDIAVLLNTNAQLQKMRRLLQVRGVPVVGSGRSDVFATRWAADLQLLLYALLHPGSERALRAALATGLLGWRAVDLLALEEDAGAWEAQLQRFADWAQCWRERGVLALLQPVIAEAAPRLLASAEGERALTDLRHLAELLESAAAQLYGPEALLAWLASARNGSAAGGEEAMREHQLRIESDTARVQLSTVHGSKGLEYNCVFLPMAWRARGAYQLSIARFHDQHGELAVDLGSAEFDDHLDEHLADDLSERLRRLYVGLTRARHACFVYVHQDLGLGGAATWRLSELGVLLGTALRNTDVEGPASWEHLQAQIPELTVVDEELASGRYRAPVQPTPKLWARGPLPPAHPYRGLYSFSALTRQSAQTESTAAQPGAEDESNGQFADLLRPTPADAAPQLAMAFPDPRLELLQRWRGPAFGDAIHEIFEQRDHRRPMSSQRQLVEDRLRAQGVITDGELDSAELERRLSAVEEMIQRALDTPLSKGLSLGGLSPAQQVAELEFCFVLDDASLGAINGVLTDHGQPQLPARSERLRGLMTGFIDLVFESQGRFHLLDYKSNDLGSLLEDFAEDALERAMDVHHYRLQALIYAVALHRYLRQRLKDYSARRHLGSSWYLFVRGLGLNGNSGVWQQSLDPLLIERLDQLFAGATEVA